MKCFILSETLLQNSPYLKGSRWDLRHGNIPWEKPEHKRVRDQHNGPADRTLAAQANDLISILEIHVVEREMIPQSQGLMGISHSLLI